MLENKLRLRTEMELLKTKTEIENQLKTMFIPHYSNFIVNAIANRKFSRGSFTNLKAVKYLGTLSGV